MQFRLLPDPQPLVERLGRDFFLQLPTHAGVYLIRDATDQVLYVGKAKNLRRRLGNYRVANPDRLSRRLLRLLHLGRRVEWEACSDEAAALARERDLLLALRPRFNRAGIWPAPPRFLVWRINGNVLELAVVPVVSDGWEGFGPLGARADGLRAALVRLVWCGLFAERGLADLPASWFRGRLPEVARLLLEEGEGPRGNALLSGLSTLLRGEPAEFVFWLEAGRTTPRPAFEQGAITSDLEIVAEFCRAKTSSRPRATVFSQSAPRTAADT